MNTGHWTAVIPARGGSKGLPDKNIRLLSGKPLYRHSVDQALEAGAKRVVLTTDVGYILQSKHAETVEVLRRPEQLCTDDTPMFPVIAHALQTAAIEGVVVLLQPTSPLRSASDIVNAIEIHQTQTFDLVMSVTDQDPAILKGGFIDGDRFDPLVDSRYTFQNRQSLPRVVKPNGAVYVADADWLLRNKGFETDKIGALRMSPESSIDIDRLEDLEACEIQLRQQDSSGPK